MTILQMPPRKAEPFLTPLDFDELAAACDRVRVTIAETTDASEMCALYGACLEMERLIVQLTNDAGVRLNQIAEEQ